MNSTARGAPGCCLVLMFKAPARSKRRLGALAREAAAHLFACAAEDLADWPGPVCLAPAAAEDARWLAGQPVPAAVVVEQYGANLGERIEHVAGRLAAAGHARQLYIGIDCPELGSGYLRDAAARLDDADAVLGPATDGGVVAMGTRARWPALGDLPWSTSRLRDALAEQLAASGLSVSTLAPLADIDSPADLDMLAERLGADTRPARRALSAWLTLNRARLRIPT